MKRALITGGAGFIGYHLAGELSEHGYEVDLLDNFSRGVEDPDLDELAKRPGMRIIRGNLLDDATTRALETGYHQIHHLAAIIGVAHVMNRPYAVLRDNAAMLAAVIELARRQGGLERLVFASTSEVYAGTLQHFGLAVPTPESVPITLPDVALPRTSYMLSKMYGEALCQQSNLPFTIVRPHNFYGPRMGLSHVIPELLKKAYAAAPGSSLDVASADHRRAFCHISDAVRMIRLLSEAPAARNETFNVGNQDQELSIHDLARMILDTVGKDMRIRPQPAAPGSPARRAPEMSKAIAACGFRPQIGLNEGIERTYRWYRDMVFEGTVTSAQ